MVTWVEMYIIAHEVTGSILMLANENFLNIFQSGVRSLGKSAINTKPA